MKHEQGYIALVAVLMIGAVCTAIAVSVLVLGADSQRSTLVTQQSAQARLLADACGEEALQVIHDSTTFTGTNNLTLGQGTCTYAVTTQDSSTKIIAVSGTVDNVVRKVKIYVTIGSSSISVTSWQEVSDL